MESLPVAFDSTWLYSLLPLLVLTLAGYSVLMHFCFVLPSMVQPWRETFRRWAAANPWTADDILWIFPPLFLGLLAAAFIQPGIAGAVALFHGVALLAILLRLRGKQNPFGHGIGVARTLGCSLYGYLAVLPIVWLVSFAWGMLLYAMGYDPGWQDSVALFMEASGWMERLWMAVLMVGVAPVVEEMLFRGILLPVLIRRIGPVAALLAVSILFGISHTVETCIPIALLSVALSYAYIRTGSLWVSIGMHALFNGVNLLLVMWLV